MAAKKKPAPASPASFRRGEEASMAAYTASLKAPAPATGAGNRQFVEGPAAARAAATPTPPVTPTEEPLPDMPSAVEMAQADAAYQDALKVLDAKEVPKVGTILRYDTGSGTGTRIPIYANGVGGEFKGEETMNPVIPGSTGKELGSERTLAKDTFANTLGLIFGAQEATQPWVNEMYNLASGFYKTGSTIEESLNLSLYDAKEKKLAPQFTKRFKGVFDLQEKLIKGEPVTVPTIAEFIKTQTAMADVLKEAGLADIAKQDFLGDIIGMGNSVLDVGNLISNVFNVIDNAPKELRASLDTYFPSVDRVSLAKALLTGTEGAAALEKRIKNVSVLSAAGSQGISTDLASASDIAARGFDYGQALTGFGQVKDLQRADTIAKFEGGSFSQKEAMALTFEQSQTAKEKAEALKAKEIGRFQGEAGLSASALRGKSSRQQI